MRKLCHDPQERERIFERRAKLLQDVSAILKADASDDVTSKQLDALQAAHKRVDYEAVTRALANFYSFRELRGI